MSPLGAISEEQFDKVFDVNGAQRHLFDAAFADRLGIDYGFYGNARLQRVQRNEGRHPEFC